MVELPASIANVDRHWNGHSSANLGAYRSGKRYAFSFSPPPNILYSHRLPWSSPPNAISNLLTAKRVAGERLLDLTCSNPTEVLPNYPHAAIRQAYGTIDNFLYHPHPAGKWEARQIISEYYLRRGVNVQPDRLFLTASTSEAYSLLFKLLCNPGDEVLVPVPSYPLFEYLAALENVRTVPYRLRYDGSWHFDFSHLRSQISGRTRAIVIVHPNNPTGSFLKNDEFSELTRTAEEHRIAIISDEVFTDYPLRPSSDPVPTLAASQGSVLTFSLNGLSKLAGMPQMKLGWIAVSGPAAEIGVAQTNLELLLDTYLSVGTPVQNALGSLLEIGATIRSALVDRIQRNWTRLHQLLAESPAHPLQTEAGWSAIVRLPRILSEDAWMDYFLQEGHIVVQPGYFFDMPEEAYIVVSLITPPDEFDEAIDTVRTLVSDGQLENR